MTDTDPEGVLTPDELTPDDDRLQELADDRFVVSVEEDAAEQPTTDVPPDPDVSDGSEGPADETAGVQDTAAADSAPEPNTDDQTRLPDPATLDGAFALAVDADLDGDRVRFTEDSNDVAATFSTLIARYADAVAPDVPTDEAVAVLINNSDLDVEVTPR